MTLRTFIAASILTAGLVIGCDKTDETTTTPRPSSPSTPATPPPGGPAEGPTNTLPPMTQLKDAGAQAQKEATGLQQQGAQAMQNAQGQAAELIKTAQAKIDEVKKAIAAGNWTNADSLLKGVESMKTQLPKEYQDQIDSLRKTINDAMARLKTPAAPAN